MSLLKVHLRIEPVAPLCGLCHLRNRKNYYCASCVQKGDFIHSGRGRGGASHGHLADKKCEALRLQRLKEGLAQSIQSRLEVKTVRDKLVEEVDSISSTITFFLK